MFRSDNQTLAQSGSMMMAQGGKIALDESNAKNLHLFHNMTGSTRIPNTTAQQNLQIGYSPDNMSGTDLGMSGAIMNSNQTTLGSN